MEEAGGWIDGDGKWNEKVDDSAGDSVEVVTDGGMGGGGGGGGGGDAASSPRPNSGADSPTPSDAGRAPGSAFEEWLAERSDFEVGK